MSRCFPYPPPGYVKIGGRGGGGSIESMKLQKEKNKIHTERRKEKKGHKEINKLLKKQTDTHDGKDKRLGEEKSLRYGKTYTSAVLANLSDDSSRSGLSEEHNQPVPSSLFDLSDGTDSSKKRKLDAPSPSTAQSGKKIRIRFICRRQSDSEGREPECSTSSREQTLTSRNADPLGQPASQIINTHVQEPSSSSCNLKFTTGRKDIPAECKEEEPSVESIYRALFEDWAAPPIFLEREYPDDQEWLFGTKQQDKKTPRRLKTETSEGAFCPTVGDLWPRAHYLPDGEIFALPYTVPF